MTAAVVREGNELLGGSYRKRTEKRFVHQREHGGVGPDSEGERDERHSGEPRPHPERPQPEPDVQPEGIEEGEAPGLAALFQEARRSTELALRGPARVLGAHAGGQVLAELHLAVNPHLLFEIALELFAAKIEQQ
ncbi:MAG TPA: hypothetical protein VIE88_17220, partial [Vicinamibacteria bacterium]